MSKKERQEIVARWKNLGQPSEFIWDNQVREHRVKVHDGDNPEYTCFDVCVIEELECFDLKDLKDA